MDVRPPTTKQVVSRPTVRLTRYVAAWAIDYAVAVVGVISVLGSACYVHRLRGDEVAWTASAPVQWLLNLGLWWSLLGLLGIAVAERLICRLCARRSPGAMLVGQKTVRL